MQVRPSGPNPKPIKQIATPKREYMVPNGIIPKNGPELVQEVRHEGHSLLMPSPLVEEKAGVEYHADGQ